MPEEVNSQMPQIKTFSRRGYLDDLPRASADMDTVANAWLRANRTGKKRITVLSVTPGQSAGVIPEAKRNPPAQQVCWIDVVTILYHEISS